jgi:putative phosphoesterase
MTKGIRSEAGPFRRFDSIKALALISDTHGLLRDSAIEALRGYEPGLIVHAGDVGPHSLLDQLETIAPVVAVRGNVDHELTSLPSTELILVNDQLIYILHNLDLLDVNPESAGIAMVVSGHSHQPKVGRKRGVHYVNPGSIGPRRFRLPVSFAKVACEGPEFIIELVSLEEIRR